MTEKSKVFPATDASLAEVISYVEEGLEAEDCPMKIVMQITVCLEEMFVNIAHYAYGEGTGDAEIGFSADNGFATITLTDAGMPFDPLAKEDPDITLTAEERRIGGLGIFMVKKTMDEVSYRRENGKNIFTMKKKIG